MSFARKHVFNYGWLLFSLALLVYWLFVGTAYDQLVMANTITLGIACSVISIPLGLVLANCCRNASMLGKISLAFVFGFALIPIVFQVSCWDSAFGRLGWITAKFSGTNQPVVSSWFAAIWIHSAALAPQLAMMFLVGSWMSGSVHEEQALVDTSAWQVFWRVTLRRQLPIIGAAVCWCIISCSREIAVTDIYQVGTLAEQVYLGFSLGQFDSVLGIGPARTLAESYTLSLGLQLLTVAWLVFTACIVLGKLTEPEWSSGELKPASRVHGKMGVNQIVQILTLLVLFAVPVGNLFTRASFHVARVDGKPVGSHSIEHFFQALRRAVIEYLPQTQWSLVIAAGCLIGTMSLAIILAWIAKGRPSSRPIIIAFLSLCFALPGPVIGTLMLQVYNRVDSDWMAYLFNRTLFPVIVGDMIVCLPIAFLLVWFVISRTPRDIEEHAQTEGAGTLQTFIQLSLRPNVLPLSGVSILCFIVAYGDLSTTQMVLPPGVESVSRLTLGLMHAGVNKMTAALTIVNVSAILAVSSLGWWLVSLNWRRVE